MSEAQLAEVKRVLVTLTDVVQEQTRRINVLETTVAETKDIVQAWEAVKVGGKFIKWLGGIATALAALWLILKVGLSHYIPGGAKP